VVSEFYCLFSEHLGALAIFNSFHNRVESGTILEDLRNFGGGGFEHPSVRHCVDLYFEIPIRCTGAVCKLIRANLRLMRPDYQDVRHIQDFQAGTISLASIDKEMAF